MIEPIDSWLFQNRGQSLNQAKTRISNLKDGISYLGYRLKQIGSPAEPLKIFVEPKKKWKLVQSLKDFERNDIKPFYKPHRLGLNIVNKAIQKNLAQINSRVGAMAHASSFLLKKKALIKTMKKVRRWYYYSIKKGYRALRIKKRRR
jgi:hypothetical protein